MMASKIKSVGIKDMHPMQIQSLASFIELAINLAANFEDESVMQEVEYKADEMIRLFGGNGVVVEIEDH